MRTGLAFGVAGALVFGSAAFAGPLMKLPVDRAAVTGLRTTKAGDMDMVFGPFPSAAPARVGYFGLNGAQYSISRPTEAEIVHVQSGQNTWVGQTGKALRVKRGDVVFFAARKANTARDAAGYTDHYILFPATGAAADKTPDVAVFNPADLKPDEFSAVDGGAEHVWLASDEGSRVVAWRAAERGAVTRTADFRYLAVTGGRATFSEGGTETAVAAGDTLLIPAGSSYSWRGEGLVGVLVSVKPKPD
jgi:uncharacterized cupin superfamily protein